MDPDPVQFAISSRRHLGRALRLLGAGIAEGRLPVSERVWALALGLADELLGPPPPADAPTPQPPA